MARSGSTSPKPVTCPWCAICPRTLLSRVVDVSQYGIIYAGAQKNLAPAGLTIVIVKKALAGHELPDTPLMLRYDKMIEKHSMYNTPPCWCIYMLGLTLEWLESQGGVPGMETHQARQGADAL